MLVKAQRETAPEERIVQEAEKRHNIWKRTVQTIHK